jgi:hypothetical protein
MAMWVVRVEEIGWNNWYSHDGGRIEEGGEGSSKKGIGLYESDARIEGGHR